MRSINLSGLLAKVEGVYGTDAVPVVGTDGVQLDEHLWGSIKSDWLERNRRPGAHSGGRMGPPVGSQPSGRYVEVNLKGVLKGAGAAYTALIKPEMDALHRGCGLQSTLTAGPPAFHTYELRSSGHESVTLYCYAAGLLFKVVGAVGKISFEADAGKNCFVSMNFMGLLSVDPTEVALPSITYPRAAVQAPLLANNALTLAAAGVAYKGWKFDPGTKIATKRRGNAPDGHAGYEIINYESPLFTAQVQRPVLATFNPYAVEAASTVFAVVAPVGSVQYNRATFTIPKGQIAATMDPGDDESIAMMSIPIEPIVDDATPLFTLKYD